MFTYVMKTKIEELIEEKLNQEFPEEVTIREDPDYDNEEEDLWIGDSGASSHMMGSEEHVFNKKLITGSVRTANGAHMKMLCEGDINVDVITKDGDVTSGTLKVKVIPGMKQKLFSFTQAMMGGWSMQGGQTKQGELFIALTHEDHKPIIFDRVLKAGNSVLLAAKMVIKNPEEVNAAIVNGKQSKEYFHRVTGHAGHHLMDATAKYYKVDLTGKVNNCLCCSLEKIRQKNIPKKNEDKSKNPGERMYVDNVGAIWLANNSSVSERTKHVDFRAHFVRDMIKDQVIEINFVKSAENDSDIMTKNQQGQHYMYAKSKLVYTVQEMNDEKDIQDEETGRMLES